MKRVLLPLLVLAAVARPAGAGTPVASFKYLVTGNGFGFQVFDVGANAIKQYLHEGESAVGGLGCDKHKDKSRHRRKCPKPCFALRHPFCVSGLCHSRILS